MATATTTEPVDTRSESERAGIKAEAESKESEAHRKQAYIDDLQEKVDRLKIAYSEVKALKESFEDIWTYDLNKHYRWFNEDSKIWVGSNYNNYETYVDDTFKPSYELFIDEVDDILDSIGNKRTEYENKIIDEQTILSALWKAINSLWNSWRNYWN